MGPTGPLSFKIVDRDPTVPFRNSIHEIRHHRHDRLLHTLAPTAEHWRTARHLVMGSPVFRHCRRSADTTPMKFFNTRLWSDKAGFTLMEIQVAMAVLLVIASTSLMFTKSALPSMRADGQARRLVSLLPHRTRDGDRVAPRRRSAVRRANQHGATDQARRRRRGARWRPSSSSSTCASSSFRTCLTTPAGLRRWFPGGVRRFDDAPVRFGGKPDRRNRLAGQRHRVRGDSKTCSRLPVRSA